ncbi:MAG: hypothetical protein AB7N80_00440 [Bdellovibrionales bacterium]
MSRRGAMAIESIGVLIASVAIIGFLFHLARSAVSHLWLDHTLYEALICLAEQQPTTRCRQRAEQSARRIPLGVDQIQIHLWRAGPDGQGEIQWQGPLNLRGRIRKKLDLKRILKADLRSSRCCY